MSDPMRPALPDPQQDRHVAFPELTPTTAPQSSTQPSQGPAGPTGPMPGLPPVGWAGHDPVASSVPRNATTPGRWQPDRSSLGTPPARPRVPPRRRRPGWLPQAAVIGFLIVMGSVNGPDDNPGFTLEGGSSQQQWGGPPDQWGDVPPDPASAGWIVTVDDPGTTSELIPSDAPVSAVRAGADVLRIEVVADSPEPVFVRINTDGRLAEEAPDGVTPLVREVHPGSDTTSLVVSVSRGTDSGASMQCRIYDGPTLVAVQTGSDKVLCTATWS